MEGAPALGSEGMIGAGTSPIQWGLLRYKAFSDTCILADLDSAPLEVNSAFDGKRAQNFVEVWSL